MEELANLKRTNDELVYLISRIEEQMEVISNEFKYLESLIRNTKDLTC